MILRQIIKSAAARIGKVEIGLRNRMTVRGRKMTKAETEVQREKAMRYFAKEMKNVSQNQGRRVDPRK